MQIFHQWDVWLASVRYEDTNQVKIRPVVIVKTIKGEQIVLALKVTSHPPREEYPGEYVLTEWRYAGLDRESTVRVSKQVKIGRGAFGRRLGALHAVDVVQIKRIMNEIRLL